MHLFDSHCHVQLPQFDLDRDAVIARMQERGMGAVVVGTDLETSRAAIALAEQHDFLWASVGLHPNDNPAEAFDVDTFAALATHPKVVAIGECGFDFYRQAPTPEVLAEQRVRFEHHVALAQAAGKPLIIHCRSTKDTENAHEALLAVLEPLQAKGQLPMGVMHFFTNTADMAKRCLTLGWYISFPGPVTFTNMYDESIKAVPLDRLLIETDAPFAAPTPHRGQRNEPAYVEEVTKKVAAIRNEPLETILAQTVKNSRTFFSL